MGKTVVADESLLPVLDTISRSEGFTVGLIFGQASEKKDYVIHLAVTPKQGNDLSHENNVKEIEQIEDNWLKVHVRNVTRSLPGGVFVLGMFIVGPKDIFNDKSGFQKIRSLITNLHSTSKSNVYLFGNNKENSTVFFFNSNSKKYQCKRFNVQNMNMSANPVTWKFVANPITWYTIETHYRMDTILPFLNSTDKSMKLKAMIKEILKECKSVIDGSICVLNGYIQNDNCNTLDDIRNLLNKQLDSKKKKESELEEHFQFKAMLFKMERTKEETKQLEIYNARESVEFSGVLSSKVFLHNLATIEEAVNAIKEDLVRSLAARLELHCDSLEDVTSSDGTIIHSPPRRVLAEHDSSGIMFSEYMFPDDTKEDIAGSFKENLGLDISSDSIIDWEPPIDFVQKDSAEIQKGKCDQTLTKSKGSMNALIFGLIGAIVILITSLVVHFLIS